MEPLSSFAINFAAGIALKLWDSSKNSVDKQIQLAFNAALKDWSVNSSIRDRNEIRFKNLLKEYLNNPDGLIEDDSSKMITGFFSFFEKRIAEHQAAFNYLLLIKNKAQYDEVTNQLSVIRVQISEMLENASIDPRDVEVYLNQLPFDKKKEYVEKKVEDLYKQKTISLELKEILIIVSNKVYERTNELSVEIEHLKATGNHFLANTLKRIKIAIEKRRPEALSEIYVGYKKKEKENKITVLKELIKSAKIIFAYNQTIKFYNELIHVQPTAENHFAYGYFLQEFNLFVDATRQYEEALQIYRELARENPKIYLPDVAATLNNLANLQKAKNEFGNALKQYEEALQIRRVLARENPSTYLPYVAETMNNLANLQKVKNQFGEALELYEEALQIYRELAQENPKIFLPYVAGTLNNLANLQKAKNELDNALEKYQEALKIYRELAQENPKKYLTDVAGTLNNLAILQQVKNEFGDALKLYEEALQIKRELAKENPKTFLPKVAMTLNNLAVLQKDNNEFGEALELYEEALQIYRELAKENPKTFLPYVAGTLNNLANLQKTKNELDDALEQYKEALKIYRELARENLKTYLKDVAGTLNNLAILHNAKNEFGEALEQYEEALQIYRELARENPSTYLPNVAMTLNNLAVLQKDKNEFGKALELYEKALQIYRELARENPSTYLPNVVMTITNMSIFYLQSIPSKKKSIALAKEALAITKQIPENYRVQQYAKTAIQVLKANRVDI